MLGLSAVLVIFLPFGIKLREPILNYRSYLNVKICYEEARKCFILKVKVKLNFEGKIQHAYFFYTEIFPGENSAKSSVVKIKWKLRYFKDKHLNAH